MANPSSLGRAPSYSNAPGSGGFEKLQNSPFGSGSLTAGLSQGIQAAGGLGNMRGTPVGRSTRDPARALEMLSRGTARPGQVEAAMGLANLGFKQAAENRAQAQFDQEQARANRITDAYTRMVGGQTAPGTATPPPAVTLDLGPDSLANMSGTDEKKKPGTVPNIFGEDESISGSLSGSVLDFGKPYGS